MWVNGVVEYICGLAVLWSTCETLGTGGVTIPRVSVG